MIRTGIAALLAFALLPTRALARAEARDTVVDGAAWIAVRALDDQACGKDVLESDLTFAKDRGVPTASLAFGKSAKWTFWERNPFARSGSELVGLVAAPRFSGKSILLPRPSRAASALLKLRRISCPLPRVAEAVPVDTPARAAPESTRTDSEAPDTAEADADSSEPVETPRASLPEATPRDTPTRSSSSPQPSKVSDLNGPDGIFTIVIDAGHGGKDPGAIGQKIEGKALQEKDATLGIAQFLRDELRGRKGVRVVMTRDSDIFLTLGERTRVANQADGDLFVSIHCNSLPLNSSRRDEVEGFMVYLLREAKSEADRAIERRENEAIRFETGERQRKDALSPVEWMLLEHQLNQFTKESERFAGYVVNRLSTKGPVKKERTGAGQAGFFVLVGALMPSVLIETGYLSHPDDASNLGSASGRKAIAREIAKAIDDFRRQGS